VRATPTGVLRLLAFGGLAAVLLILVYLLFAGGGGADYHLEFEDASQLVPGDQVQVGGVPVGSVKKISLTPDYRAIVTIHVDSSLTPLHEGTSAEIRVPSLSGVANRYVALNPGPNNEPSLGNGAKLPASRTKGVVDLDQLFNTLNPRTRKGLEQFIEGNAELYAGAENAANLATGYFGPALNAIDHVFSELSSDQKTFTSFLVDTSDALTIIGNHSQHLSELIGHSDTTFQAIGAQQSSLARGLHELPGALSAGVKTFNEVPSTFHALRELVDVSKQDTKTLAPFFANLRSLLQVATPTVRNLSVAISSPGPNNDLTDVALALPGLAKALSTGSPDNVRALEESVPVTAFFGPYSPDLQGLFRDFGLDNGYYDANGHYSRVSPAFESFKLNSSNELKPVTPQQGLEGLKTGQLRRCPGSATQPASDGSSPFTDEGKLSCDPTETP
jgi:phospholipid/cholesterol/gamma-HCH transport system substrate-binding protein